MNVEFGCQIGTVQKIHVLVVIIILLFQCGNESARVDSYLDIPLVIRPFGSIAAHGSVVSTYFVLNVFLVFNLVGDTYGCIILNYLVNTKSI